MLDNDMDIVRKVLSGRQEAFRVLMEKYSGLSGYYLKTHFKLGEEEVKDLTQEAFLKAYQGLATLRPDSTFKSWLIRIIRNTAIDYLRKIPANSRSVSLDQAYALADKKSESFKKLVIQEMTDRLPERQREIISLFHFWELPSAQIGSILGIPEGTVRSDLRLARLRLAELLEDQESL